jgi:hypothetical protein
LDTLRKHSKLPLSNVIIVNIRKFYRNTARKI